MQVPPLREALWVSADVTLAVAGIAVALWAFRDNSVTVGFAEDLAEDEARRRSDGGAGSGER